MLEAKVSNILHEKKILFFGIQKRKIGHLTQRTLELKEIQAQKVKAGKWVLTKMEDLIKTKLFVYLEKFIDII